MLSDKTNEGSSEMHQKLKTALVSGRISKIQFEVYNHLLLIPKGKVTTYKAIAKAVNCNSAQAIGQALRKNPFAPEVPCHRVVKADLTLGGFSGGITDKTVEKKMMLLREEGIKIEMKNDTHSCSQAKVDKENLL